MNAVGRFAIASVSVVLSLDAAACSGAEMPMTAGASRTDAGLTDGALGVDSPGIVLAHESNVLIKNNHELRCELCPPCGAFKDVGSQGDVCAGMALDQFPESKGPFFCTIEAARRYGNCLRGALDCSGAAGCDAAKATDEARCPVFTGDTSGLMLPPECTQ